MYNIDFYSKKLKSTDANENDKAIKERLDCNKKLIINILMMTTRKGKRRILFFLKYIILIKVKNQYLRYQLI